ncbi:hypothetical protein EB796_006380 [Bugula neritina]|uniref:Cyclic nucleotide-binding domain-containing protein n=1 Tax=Bugula neritina TaxID=10212 RepID=A0A7J7K9I9_BUGNE|nr:hypothetical protein EB796_006380 [Bugula neritina]
MLIILGVKSFPEQIQADICLHLNKNLLHNNPAFKGASPGCLSMHLGDLVTSIYFIARGSIEILKDDVCMAILGRGDIFGLSVDDLEKVVKSNYNVHALTFCDMNKIDAYDLKDIFDMYPEFTENFKKRFSLTFNLKMGEYKTLVTPQAMDEETLKLIRQRRPKMQCKGDFLLNSSLPHTSDEESLTRRFSVASRKSELMDAPQSSTILELTPSGHGVWSLHDPPKPHNRRNSETKVLKKVKIETPLPTDQLDEEAEGEEKTTFKHVMQLTSRLQKQTDFEESATADSHCQLMQTSQEAIEKERQHLCNISARIDDCFTRINKVEEFWDTNVRLIFQLLDQPYVEQVQQSGCV